MVEEARGLSEQRQARKASLVDRVKLAAGAVNAEPSEPWLVWCDLNDESAALTAAIPGAVEVTGSDSAEHKETAMEDFIAGKIRVLVSKPSILGWGVNLQHCARVAYVGLSHSFEAWYQSIRRVYRFGQKRAVECHVITSDGEGAVVTNLKRKQADAMRRWSIGDGGGDERVLERARSNARFHRIQTNPRDDDPRVGRIGDAMNEEWKEVFGGNYEVSNLGRFRRATDGRRTWAGRIIKPILMKIGYLSVRPVVDGKNVYVYLHRVVAEAFMGACPDGKEVNHVDGDKGNPSARSQPRIHHPRGEQRPCRSHWPESAWRSPSRSEGHRRTGARDPGGTSGRGKRRVRREAIRRVRHDRERDCSRHQAEGGMKVLDQAEGEDWVAYNGDRVEVVRRLRG